MWSTVLGTHKTVVGSLCVLERPLSVIKGDSIYVSLPSQEDVISVRVISGGWGDGRVQTYFGELSQKQDTPQSDELNFDMPLLSQSILSHNAPLRWNWENYKQLDLTDGARVLAFYPSKHRHFVSIIAAHRQCDTHLNLYSPDMQHSVEGSMQQCLARIEEQFQGGRPKGTWEEADIYMCQHVGPADYIYEVETRDTHSLLAAQVWSDTITIFWVSWPILNSFLPLRAEEYFSYWDRSVLPMGSARVTVTTHSAELIHVVDVPAPLKGLGAYGIGWVEDGVILTAESHMLLLMGAIWTGEESADKFKFAQSKFTDETRVVAEPTIESYAISCWPAELFNCLVVVMLIPQNSNSVDKENFPLNARIQLVFFHPPTQKIKALAYGTDLRRLQKLSSRREEEVFVSVAAFSRSCSLEKWTPANDYKGWQQETMSQLVDDYSQLVQERRIILRSINADVTRDMMLRYPVSPIWDVVEIPNLRFLCVTFLYCGSIFVLSTETEQWVAQLETMAPWVTCMQALPDGYQLLTGDSCGNIKIWNLQEVLQSPDSAAGVFHLSHTVGQGPDALHLDSGIRTSLTAFAEWTS